MDTENNEMQTTASTRRAAKGSKMEEQEEAICPKEDESQGNGASGSTPWVELSSGPH